MNKHNYFFWNKCTDFDDGNEVQEITHWDEYANNEYAIDDDYLNEKIIEIISKEEFEDLIAVGEYAPVSAEYYAINHHADIVWAYDINGIHWFYTKQ